MGCLFARSESHFAKYFSLFLLQVVTNGLQRENLTHHGKNGNKTHMSIHNCKWLVRIYLTQKYTKKGRNKVYVTA